MVPGRPAQPGRVTRTLLKWLMKPARVAAADALSPRFRLISFDGDELSGATWSPGDKVKVAMGGGLSTRTYTPMSWDADRGGTQILAFSHGDGPGSHWASNLRVGDTCQFFGPRRSIDLSGLETPAVLFGDETSFGLAHAFRNSPQGAGVSLIFETSNLAESRSVLDAIGLGDASLFERVAGDAHLVEIGAELARHASASAQFILTGKASSIQNISRALKVAGVGSARLSVKAYWASGKTGLD